MGLPVVARTRGEHRIERRLPAAEGMRADDVGNRPAQRPQRRHGLLPGLHVARIAGGKDKNLGAVHLGRQERQGRRLAHHDPAGELLGRRRHEAPILLEPRPRLGEGMHDEAREHLRPQPVQLQLERGDHAEIAAAAPERPEEVGVLALARTHEPAVCGDEVGRDEIVRGQAELAAGPAEAAAQRQPGDAGRRVDAGRRHQAERLRLAVELAQRDAGLDAHRPRNRVDAHRFHRREVQHHAALADGVAGDVVPAAAHGQRCARLTREIDRGHHICGTGAAHDHARTPVDHRVPDAAGGVIAFLAGNQHGTPHPPLELLDHRLRNHRHVTGELLQAETGHRVPPDHHAFAHTSQPTLSARPAGTGNFTN